MKKQLFIFFIMLASAVCIDIRPLDLTDMRSDEITITIQGAVDQPGSLTIPLYSTISDVLEMTTLREDADTSSLNPNTILKDADVLNIPVKKQEEEIQRISINSATLEELCLLEGIGESTAQKIIDYRNTNGLFQSIEELMQVKGIGNAKFEKIKDMITL